MAEPSAFKLFSPSEPFSISVLLNPSSEPFSSLGVDCRIFKSYRSLTFFNAKPTPSTSLLILPINSQCFWAHQKQRHTGRDEIEQLIRDCYPQVLDAVISGTSVIKAVQTAGMSRYLYSLKYKNRWLPQMKIVDPQHDHHLTDQFRSSGKLSEECKAALSDEDSYGWTPAVP